MVLTLPVDPETTWPPPVYDPVAHMQRLWAAWFSGSPGELSWAYYNLGENSSVGRAYFMTTGEPSAGQQRAGQYRGGLLGSVDRTFWGLATPPGEKRTKLHVPVAGDISAMSADLLFAKPPRFTVGSTANAATRAWLDARLDDDLHATLLEAAEVCSALGGVFLRTVWDTDIADRPWLSIVHPDAAVPTFRHGKLVSVIFWQVLRDEKGDVVRHLEGHDIQNNRITHRVYVGDAETLGDEGSLGDFPELEPITAALDADQSLTFPDLPADASTVTYVPNMRPNRLWRNLPAAHALGRSDYAGTEGMMDALDETYSAWIRDIRLAKSRLIVPPSYLENIGPGKGAVLEPDKEVFVPMNLLAGSADAANITANQFAIRWQEHEETMAKTLTRIVTAAGYSTATFGEFETGSTPMTATEVENRERRTMLTRAKKALYWGPALADAMYSLLAVEQSVFGRTELEPVRPDVDWPEAVMPSMQELSQTALALNTANAASRQTLVAMVHPDWTDEQVHAEVERLRDEMPEDILGRARVSLASPMNSTETVGQQLEDVAATMNTSVPTNITEGAAINEPSVV